MFHKNVSQNCVSTFHNAYNSVHHNISTVSKLCLLSCHSSNTCKIKKIPFWTRKGNHQDDLLIAWPSIIFSVFVSSNVYNY
jgi:hypothetical protein